MFKVGDILVHARTTLKQKRYNFMLLIINEGVDCPYDYEAIVLQSLNAAYIGKKVVYSQNYICAEYKLYV
jgi:hypothetical protein